MRSQFWAYPKGCKEFKAVLDSGVDDSLANAFIYGSRAVKRAAKRKIRRLVKSQLTISNKTKGKK